MQYSVRGSNFYKGVGFLRYTRLEKKYQNSGRSLLFCAVPFFAISYTLKKTVFARNTVKPIILRGIMNGKPTFARHAFARYTGMILDKFDMGVFRGGGVTDEGSPPPKIHKKIQQAHMCILECCDWVESRICAVTVT